MRSYRLSFFPSTELSRTFNLQYIIFSYAGSNTLAFFIDCVVYNLEGDRVHRVMLLLNWGKDLEEVYMPSII